VTAGILLWMPKSGAQSTKTGDTGSNCEEEETGNCSGHAVFEACVGCPSRAVLLDLSRDICARSTDLDTINSQSLKP
jgi:hypothetical protein